jgi:glycosyltransferase involved in cell wall biosynthesis
MVGTLGLRRVSFGGPIYGEEKFTAYREADVFVLPSLNENFGLTVAESLACGTPVIASRSAPWSGLEDEACGWWVEPDVGPLANALADAMSLPRIRLKALGANGRAWMVRDFSWDNVALEMSRLYDWLINGGEAPASVRRE